MVPGVSLQRLRVHLVSHFLCDAEDPFLRHNAGQSSNECYGLGRAELFALEKSQYLLSPVVGEHESHHEERHADDRCCHSLIFAVAIVVVIVGRLGAQLYEDDDNDIGDEVAQRVYSIRYHGSRMTEDARREFQSEQQEVDYAAKDGYSVYLRVAVLSGVCHRGSMGPLPWPMLW